MKCDHPTPYCEQALLLASESRMLIRNLVKFLSEKFPALWVVVYRTASRLLRHFPYQPLGEGAGIEDGPDWLVVRPSLIANAGDGLFTTRFCPAGTVLCEYKGTKLTGLQLLRTPDWTYVYNYEFEFWIDPQHHPGVKARYINDNFDPSKLNVTWAARDGKVYLEATRDIVPGEELYVEYGAEYWENHEFQKGLPDGVTRLRLRPLQTQDQ